MAGRPTGGAKPPEPKTRSQSSACTEAVSAVGTQAAMRHLYADFIAKVSKPARYLGGEYQSVTKETADARICLAFPDVYDIGMSHLGTKIIYSLINKDPRIACERAYAPWTDMEEELRSRGLPLV